RVRALLAEGRRKDAVKMVRKEAGLDSRGAKDYVGAIQGGYLPAAPPVGAAPAGPPPVPQQGAWGQGAWGQGTLSDRVRAMKRLGDHESAIATVCAETGMTRDEARAFVEALA